MLKNLYIENIAVIEKTSIDFTGGLNVLTGETGAGKSIVIDSINAVLGNRTSRDLIRNGAETAFVSAEFEDISGMYYDWTATNDTWKVQHCDARTMSYISKTEDDAMVTLWYDAAPGLMYSLSAAGKDLNGLDLPVLADQIYIPTQGNAG